jgi:flavin reductase (DIM6/NTAB) family NADH-FMN oxidoreductase RutF
MTCYTSLRVTHGCKVVSQLRRAEDTVGPQADPDALRRVCGAFATGVAVVSAVSRDGALCGLTANSFSSVSLSPPLVLWSLRRTSRALPVFDAAGAYAISILAHDQDGIARRFAGGGCPFDEVAHRPGALGAPVLEGCVAYLECRPYDRFVAGDHVIFVWLVEQAHNAAPRPALAFQGGGYGRIESIPESTER